MGLALWVHPQYNPQITTTVVMDRAGRVVIPKSLRKELQLKPGDTLKLETTGDHITLFPEREQPRL